MEPREFEVVTTAEVRASNAEEAACEFFRLAAQGLVSTTVRDVDDDVFDLQVSPWPGAEAGTHRVMVSYTFETQHAHEAHLQMLGLLAAHHDWFLVVTDLATGEGVEVDGQDLTSGAAPGIR